MRGDPICVEPPGQWINPSLREAAYESFVNEMLIEMEAESGDSNLQEVLIKVWNEHEFDEKVGVIPEADYSAQEELKAVKKQLSEKNKELREFRNLLTDLMYACRDSKAAKIVSVLAHIERELKKC